MVFNPDTILDHLRPVVLKTHSELHKLFLQKAGPKNNEVKKDIAEKMLVFFKHLHVGK